MTGSPPRISIITPCLNRASFVREAVESVLAQDHPDFEHIVMDGGSTDGTLEVLAEYPHLTVVSEPDDGLYDAINKGIERSSGEVIGLLNTDDYYLPGALKSITEKFAEFPELEMVSGGAVSVEERGGRKETTYEYPPDAASGMDLIRLTTGVALINARFFRRKLFGRVAPFDTGYRIAADRDWMLRLWAAGVKNGAVDQTVYCYRMHRDSLSMNRGSREASGIVAEHLRMALRYGTDAHMPTALRRACNRWHSAETAECAGRSLRAGNLAGTVRYAALGWSRDLFWPVRLVKYMLAALLRGVRG